MGLFNDKLDLQGAVGKIKERATDTFQQITDKSEVSGDNVPQQETGRAIFCQSCGTKLNEGAKFCHNCGTEVRTIPKVDSQEIPPIPQNMKQSHFTERQQEFVGKILKCPNCGGNIAETTAVCPQCGMQITGKSALSSVQEFKEQLMEIERKRKINIAEFIGGIGASANKSDIQKLTLIRNFPIPSSIDDCMEFMMLAIANIDVKLSKNTLSNKLSGHKKSETVSTINRSISNAWVSKMEQVYRKAEILFPNTPEFESLQKIYYEKMEELKIKSK